MPKRTSRKPRRTAKVLVWTRQPILGTDPISKTKGPTGDTLYAAGRFQIRSAIGHHAPSRKRNVGFSRRRGEFRYWLLSVGARQHPSSWGTLSEAKAVAEAIHRGDIRMSDIYPWLARDERIWDPG